MKIIEQPSDASYDTDKHLLIDVDRKEMTAILEQLFAHEPKNGLQLEQVEGLYIRIPSPTESKLTPRNYLEIIYQIACTLSFWFLVAFVAYRIIRRGH